MRAAGLGAGAGKAVAAERLHADHRTDHVAVDIDVADGKPVDHGLDHIVDPRMDAERQSVTTAFDRLQYLIELRDARQLTSEQFGPLLHVVRYRASELEQVLESIRGSGYGLTLGVQTRLESTWQRVFRATSTGNTYVNRNMIGAVVGVQPFGGTGLSGTGPKAGGPHYLTRFASERTLTVNTTATGGNAALLRLG